MRKVREVLRLKHVLGMSYRKISEATGVGKTQAAEYVRRAMPFAARFQAILIVVMFATFVLILQQGSKPLYQIGLTLFI